MGVETAILVAQQHVEVGRVDVGRGGREAPAFVGREEGPEKAIVSISDKLRARRGAAHVRQRRHAHRDFRRDQHQQGKRGERRQRRTQSPRRPMDHGVGLFTFSRPSAVRDVATGGETDSASVGGSTKSPAETTRA